MTHFDAYVDALAALARLPEGLTEAMARIDAEHRAETTALEDESRRAARAYGALAQAVDAALAQARATLPSADLENAVPRKLRPSGPPADPAAVAASTRSALAAAQLDLEGAVSALVEGQEAERRRRRSEFVEE